MALDKDISKGLKKGYTKIPYSKVIAEKNSKSNIQLLFCKSINHKWDV